MKAPVVLLTDYGLQDPYAGILHGVIRSLAPHIPIIDLTHGIEPQNIRQASFYLEDSVRYFPKGSVFVCVVDPGVGTKRRILCAKTNSYYFLAPDNGLLSGIAARESFTEVRELTNKKYALLKINATFHGRDLFAPAASALARKPSCFKNLGPITNKMVWLNPLPLIKTKSAISGEVVYFDHFGNAVTNITFSDAASSFWKTSQVTAGNKKIGPIEMTYGRKQQPLALWNSAERLEIAVPCGRASSFLKVGTSVKVSYDK